MIEIDWRSDYKREFACPRCGEIGMRLGGVYYGKKRQFRCLKCKKTSLNYVDLSSRRAKIKSYWKT